MPGSDFLPGQKLMSLYMESAPVYVVFGFYLAFLKIFRGGNLKFLVFIWHFFIIMFNFAYCNSFILKYLVTFNSIKFEF